MSFSDLSREIWDLIYRELLCLPANVWLYSVWLYSYIEINGERKKRLRLVVTVMGIAERRSTRIRTRTKTRKRPKKTMMARALGDGIQ